MKSYGSARRGDRTRLLLVGAAARVGTVLDITEQLRGNDLVVVNESGTVPASLRGTLERTGEFLELRLAVREGESRWLAVAFGAGSWREATEERGAAPSLRSGDVLRTGGCRAHVETLDARHPRLAHVRLEGDLYRYAAPVQYSYHRNPLALWDAQTLVAGEPWSVEAPSALFPLTFERLLALRRRCRVEPILHGAGLSSTGEVGLDALLPLPEPYRVPARTWEAVLFAKRNGGRILAWGTTVARALESAYESGELQGLARLRLGAGRPPRVVDGVVTGIHDVGTSHYALEEAFVPREWLERAYGVAREAKLLGHEYGDLALLWKAGL